ncbi:MAG: hypothetical protein QXF59_00825 [Candidatus Bathyarchaeia archaeon]
MTDTVRLAEYASLIPTPEQGGGSDLTKALGVPLSRFLSYTIPIITLFVLGYVALKIAFQGVQMWGPGQPEKRRRRQLKQL